MLDDDELYAIAEELEEEELEADDGSVLSADAIAAVLICLKERGVDLRALSDRAGAFAEELEELPESELA